MFYILLRVCNVLYIALVCMLVFKTMFDGTSETHNIITDRETGCVVWESVLLLCIWTDVIIEAHF